MPLGGSRGGSLLWEMASKTHWGVARALEFGGCGLGVKIDAACLMCLMTSVIGYLCKLRNAYHMQQVRSAMCVS